MRSDKTSILRRSSRAHVGNPSEQPHTLIRQQLKIAGYSPIPLIGKIPELDEWQTKIDVAAEEIDSWARIYPRLRNTGILTKFTPALDIDIINPAAAEAIEQLARERFEKGYFLVRIGQAPKRAILLRTDTPFKKIKRVLFAANGASEQKIEFLADGQQLAAFGIHPQTRQPYSWHGGEPGQILRGDLPYVSELEAHAFVKDAVALLASEFGFTEVQARAKKINGDQHIVDGHADWSSLLANITAGRDLHDATRDLAAKLLASGMSGGATVNMIRAAMLNSTIERDERFEERFNDIPRAVSSAREKFGQENPNKEQQPAQKIPLPFINMSKWDSDPIPERQWSVPDRYPLRQTALFSGEGAVGKSIVQLHLSCAHVLGRDWLGTMPEPGPALFIDAEDDINELHRRLAAILTHSGAAFADVIAGGLHLMSFAGRDAVLATTSRGGKIESTALYKQLFEAAGDIKPKMIGIASSADVFAGSEIERSHVQQFISLLTKMAIVSNGSVVLLSHPSLTGINSGTGISGTTQWHNSVRARAYMTSVRPEEGQQPDSDLREIVFKKNNYGPVSASIVLRWKNGLFLPVAGVSSLDQAAQDQRADDVFIELLRRFTAANRHVSDRQSPTYAPAVFAKEDPAKKAGIASPGLASAMRRLFAAGRIWNEPCGKPSRPSFRIALKR
jgi:RecA-family ATPase